MNPAGDPADFDTPGVPQMAAVAGATVGAATLAVVGTVAVAAATEDIVGDAVATGIRTEARNLIEQMALNDAKAGAGERIMQGLIDDPLYAEGVWAKMQYVLRTDNGYQVVIHYWRRIEDGFSIGFKFK